MMTTEPNQPTRTVCLGCGCLCDDLIVSPNPTALADIHFPPAVVCPLGQAWLAQAGPAWEAPPLQEDISVGGRMLTPSPSPTRGEGSQAACFAADCAKTYPFKEALTQAATLLRQARQPLFYGLTEMSTETQRAALALADEVRAVIDTATNATGVAWLRAFQQCGRVTCTLGEIRQRADVMVCWNGDPVTAQPRFLERTGFDTRARCHEASTRGSSSPPLRYLAVIDAHTTATATLAEDHFAIRPGADLEVWETFRALLKGVPLSAAAVEQRTGVSLARWKQLFARVRQARYAVFSSGDNWVRDDLGGQAFLALHQFARDLNNTTAAACLLLSGSGNNAGAENVLAWTTGYPRAVSLQRGFPASHGQEFAGDRLLSERAIDAVLLLGTRGQQTLSPAALEGLRSIPFILLDPAPASFLEGTTLAPLATFTTAVEGIEVGGTAYRLDDVPLSLRPFRPATRPTAEQVLRALLEKCRR